MEACGSLGLDLSGYKSVSERRVSDYCDSKFL